MMGGRHRAIPGFQLIFQFSVDCLSSNTRVHDDAATTRGPSTLLELPSAKHCTSPLREKLRPRHAYTAAFVEECRTMSPCVLPNETR